MQPKGHPRFAEEAFTVRHSHKEGSLLRKALQDRLSSVECAIRWTIWRHAVEHQDDNPRIQHLLHEMEASAHQFEVTAANHPESELVDDDLHKELRCMLTLEIGNDAGARSSLEPILAQRSSLRRQLKEVRAFEEKSSMN